MLDCFLRWQTNFVINKRKHGSCSSKLLIPFFVVLVFSVKFVVVVAVLFLLLLLFLLILLPPLLSPSRS